MPSPAFSNRSRPPGCDYPTTTSSTFPNAQISSLACAKRRYLLVNHVLRGAVTGNVPTMVLGTSLVGIKLAGDELKLTRCMKYVSFFAPRRRHFPSTIFILYPDFVPHTVAPRPWWNAYSTVSITQSDIGSQVRTFIISFVSIYVCTLNILRKVFAILSHLKGTVDTQYVPLDPSYSWRA